MAVETPSGSGPSPPGEGPSEILARINQREQEIEGVLLEAREAAAALLREARLKAEAVAAARREEVEREAARAAAVIVAEARAEADRILAAGSRQAAEILGTPRERIADAAQRLLALVLPGPAAGGGP